MNGFLNAALRAGVLIIAGATSAVAMAQPMGSSAASHLLSQATFGATLGSVEASAGQTYDEWFAAQAAIKTEPMAASVPDDHTNWYEIWLTHAVRGDDQLRQRLAFALSEIFVLSNNGGPLIYQNRSLAQYYDILLQDGLGNYRTLLEHVTLSPQMGRYLSMFRNEKPNASQHLHADENYAREVMQLFTVGLVQLNIDGSVKTDGSAKPVSTYTQTDVEQLARVLTGWGSYPNGHHYGEQSWQYDIDYGHPMIPYPAHHDTKSKIIIGGVAIASGGTAQGELKVALDTLFNHPNVAPFIGKQLIQRLVTSNPSPAYLTRVARVFNDNGRGVRGDLLAVAQAILTDPEATGLAHRGKLREPLLKLTGLWRAFDAADSRGKISEYLVVQDSEQNYGQAPLQAPSVFNFFRPDYERAGAATANLTLPELQVTNENTLVRLSDQLTWQAYAFIDSRGEKHAGYQNYSEANTIHDATVMLHTAQWEPYAAHPEVLVDKLDLVLMAGQMPAAMRQRLISYVKDIPATSPWSRVAEAAELTVNSPQYAVQR